ncbi:MAG: YihA family ribosome biogenesis GTP-binding protein [Armatimonadetes bacterium]|nr:YihA family ribosome biogenesis GTP-binding protein [Armatimonadota bacterium]
MKIRSAEFVKSAPTLAQAPDLGGLPEFVLVGRSNVGKSSFINTVVGRKSLAKTSNTPGKTRLMNFYRVNEEWVLVDLPGYGYAKVSRAEQQNWQRNFEKFLAGREVIRAVFHLFDARHGPQPSDLEMFGWLRAQDLEVAVVLTKADKLSRNQVQRQISEAARALELDRATVLAFSAATGAGRADVLNLIRAQLAAFVPEVKPPFLR